MSLDRRVPPACEEPEPFVETSGNVGRRHRHDARRGELEGEGNAIEAATDVGDGVRVVVINRKIRAHRVRPLREQHRRFRSSHVTGRRLAGHVQRAERPDLLTGESEALAAGDEDAHARTALQDRSGKLAHRA